MPPSRPWKGNKTKEQAKVIIDGLMREDKELFLSFDEEGKPRLGGTSARPSKFTNRDYVKGLGQYIVQNENQVFFKGLLDPSTDQIDLQLVKKDLEGKRVFIKALRKFIDLDSTQGRNYFNNVRAIPAVQLTTPGTKRSMRRSNRSAKKKMSMDDIPTDDEEEEEPEEEESALPEDERGNDFHWGNDEGWRFLKHGPIHDQLVSNKKQLKKSKIGELKKELARWLGNYINDSRSGDDMILNTSLKQLERVPIGELSNAVRYFFLQKKGSKKFIEEYKENEHNARDIYLGLNDEEESQVESSQGSTEMRQIAYSTGFMRRLKDTILKNGYTIENFPDLLGYLEEKAGGGDGNPPVTMNKDVFRTVVRPLLKDGIGPIEEFLKEGTSPSTSGGSQPLKKITGRDGMGQGVLRDRPSQYAPSLPEPAQVLSGGESSTSVPGTTTGLVAGSEGSQSVVEKQVIEAIENVADQEAMMLANLAYYPNLVPPTLEVIEEGGKDNDYRVFYNEESNTVTLAFSGTDGAEDAAEDALLLTSRTAFETYETGGRNRVPEMMKMSRQLFKDMVQKYGNGMTFRVTGHSLGANESLSCHYAIMGDKDISDADKQRLQTTVFAPSWGWFKGQPNTLIDGKKVRAYALDNDPVSARLMNDKGEFKEQYYQPNMKRIKSPITDELAPGATSETAQAFVKFMFGEQAKEYAKNTSPSAHKMATYMANQNGMAFYKIIMKEDRMTDEIALKMTNNLIENGITYNENEIQNKNLNWEIIEDPESYVINNMKIANEAGRIRDARMGDPIKNNKIEDPVNTNATERRRRAYADALEEKAEDDEADDILTTGTGGGGIQAPLDAGIDPVGAPQAQPVQPAQAPQAQPAQAPQAQPAPPAQPGVGLGVGADGGADGGDGVPPDDPRDDVLKTYEESPFLKQQKDAFRKLPALGVTPDEPMFSDILHPLLQEACNKNYHMRGEAFLPRWKTWMSKQGIQIFEAKMPKGTNMNEQISIMMSTFGSFLTVQSTDPRQIPDSEEKKVMWSQLAFMCEDYSRIKEPGMSKLLEALGSVTGSKKVTDSTAKSIDDMTDEELILRASKGELKAKLNPNVTVEEAVKALRKTIKSIDSDGNMSTSHTDSSGASSRSFSKKNADEFVYRDEKKTQPIILDEREVDAYGAYSFEHPPDGSFYQMDNDLVFVIRD